MPRGGLRAGAGRPPGTGKKLSLAPPALPQAPNYRRFANEALTGIDWLVGVVNDDNAEPVRRDRAAAILVSIEYRSGRVTIGKKALAQDAARAAGWGTPWYRLLHSQDEPGFDPAGIPADERKEWEEEQQRLRSREQSASPSPPNDEPQEPPGQSKPVDDADKWDRYLFDAGEPKPSKWVDPKTGRSDLEFRPQPYRYPSPPDDE
jgi:hypothetical protein